MPPRAATAKKLKASATKEYEKQAAKAPSIPKAEPENEVRGWAPRPG